MYKIEEILSGDFSAYPADTQDYMNKFTEKLRDHITTELIDDLAGRMLKDIKKGNKTFINILTEIVDNGCKGYSKMSTTVLLNTYLEKKTEVDFITLIEKVSKEMEV